MLRFASIACLVLNPVFLGSGAVDQQDPIGKSAEADAIRKTLDDRATFGNRSAPSTRMVVSRNVQYDQIDGVEPNLLSLDIYAPGKDEPSHAFPVVIMIHGGGWRWGDKSNLSMWRFKAPHFVGHGFVYVSINYRLSSTPESPKHPAHVQDVAKAVAWVHAHIQEYGGDPDALFVMGHSAGAHLAALVSTDDRRLMAEDEDLSIIKGTICLDTAGYNIWRYFKEMNPARFGRLLYRNAFGTTEDGWRDASPQHHVAPGKNIPPMLIFYTGQRADSENIALLSEEMVATLRAAGTPAQFIPAAEKSHSQINWCIGQPDDPYTALIMKFLENPQGANELQRDATSTDVGPDEPGHIDHDE